MNKNVLLIQFSSRKAGNCTSISSYIQDYYSNENVCSYVVDSESMPPCGNCDYECLKAGAVCPRLTDSQKEIFDAVCNTDLALFIVPNYCGFPCANYFAFNERSVGYFNMNRELMQKYMSVEKHFIAVSNTETQNFENAFMQQVNSKPSILYLKTGKYGKRSIAGDLLDSDAAKAELQAYLDAIKL